MLKRTFFLSFTLFLFLSLFAKIASADDPRISVNHSPQPVKIDSGKVTFTIIDTSSDPKGLFDTGHDYFYKTSSPDKRIDCTFPQSVKPISSKKIEASININGCHINVLGERKFQLWYSSRPASSNVGTIVSDYRFIVEQKGGGNPSITAVNRSLGPSDTPKVNLINARAGNTYEIWWHNAMTNFAADKQKPTSDGNINNITLSKDGGDFSTPGIKILCMDVADHYYPASSTCFYRTEFDFSILPPVVTPGKPTCSIEPAFPVPNDSVALKGINLDPNQEFHADLASLTSRDTTDTQKSDDKGTVTLNLKTNIPEGSYVAEIFLNPSGEFMCNQTFNATKNNKNFSNTKVCTEDEKKSGLCTFSKGKQCEPQDPTNPAIATAIGCIHTNPINFIQDLLKFLTAIAGGFAFLLMVIGAFQMVSSAGNPETLAAGRDRMTSAIIGLLFVIFAILLLKIIGVDILGIFEAK